MPNLSDAFACNPYAGQDIDAVKQMAPSFRWRCQTFVTVIFLTLACGTNLACCADDASDTDLHVGKSTTLEGEGVETENTETQFLTSENPNSENPNEEETDGETSSTTEAEPEPESIDCTECWACNPPPLPKCIPVCTGECDACC